MPEERGDSRFTSFLIGFLIGALLAGAGTTAFFVYRERDLMRAATHAQMIADVQAVIEATARRQAEAARRRADDDLKHLQEK